ncbi:MAG TPA: Hpt domain-containing protein, partial [Chthoniobacteraceae bacterium]|nr:Hpt domain-containing protein [Chthoniobacteraceae bacterium]
MEATIPLQSNFQASAPEPSKRKSNSLLISISLFAILVLGALGLGIYSWAGTHPSATGATNLAYIHVVQAALLVLSLVAFGSIIAPLLRAQKNQVLTLEQKSKDLAEAGRQLDQTKTELERVNSQLSLSVFQLQNANVQFDIITSELDAAKREADAIFATVRQGLFLLGPDGTIGAQMSGELKAIFQTNELAKRNFAQLLRPLVPEKRHQTIADYVELLFDARKNDKQLQKFNPLKRVELNFASPEGGFQSKCVEFSFQRIINQKKVARVMVTALDITERVKLEDKLREGEVLREKQLELLFDLLQVDGTQLQTFLTEATAGVDKINAVFMEPGTGVAGQLQDKVQRVFRVAHNLKSQAAALGMHLFEKTIHQIEDQLNELRRCVSLATEDMLPVLVSISNFQAQIKDSTALIE